MPSDEPSPEEFLRYVRTSGVISAHNVIPPAEIELCITDGERFLLEGIGEFAPLMEVDLTRFSGREPRAETA